jgi:hypothetical protein
MLDRVITWCREARLWVVLDMHCAPGGQTGDNIDDSWGMPWLFESRASQLRVASVWRAIADRYRNETAVIGYDLLNEPIPHFADTARYNARLEPLYKEIVRAIREVDQNHLIFLGGAQWNTNFRVFGPPFASGLVYTWHKYWTDTTRAVFEEYIAFRDRHNVPIWLGETGENTDAWVGAFRRLVERDSIGWCFWPYKKMDASSCMVTFDRPEGYDLVIEYEKRGRKTFEEMRTKRPPQEAVRAALDGFIRNCRFANCRPNTGFLEALGLTRGPRRPIR